MRTWTLAAIAASALLAAGCTAQQRNYAPVVDFRSSPAGGANYNRDLWECQQIAAQRSPVDRTAENAIGGALAGAVIGGVIGSFDGNFGKGAGAGAAIGGTAGVVKGAYEGTREQEDIVMNCLAARGYAVVGR